MAERLQTLDDVSKACDADTMTMWNIIWRDHEARKNEEERKRSKKETVATSAFVTRKKLFVKHQDSPVSD